MLKILKILLILNFAEKIQSNCGKGCRACHPSTKCFVPDFIRSYQVNQTTYLPLINARCNNSITDQINHICQAMHCKQTNQSFFDPITLTCDDKTNLISQNQCSQTTLAFEDYSRRYCPNPGLYCECDSFGDCTSYGNCNWTNLPWSTNQSSLITEDTLAVNECFCQYRRYRTCNWSGQESDQYYGLNYCRCKCHNRTSQCLDNEHETQFRSMCHFCKESSLSPLNPRYRPGSTGDCVGVPANLQIANCRIYSSSANPTCYKCIDNTQYQDNACQVINSAKTCRRYQRYQCHTCKTGYQLNKNYWVRKHYLRGGTFSYNAELIYNQTWAKEYHQFWVDQCEPKTVSNCIDHYNGVFCKECILDFVPLNDKRSCYELLLLYVEFCLDYGTEQQYCTNCIQSYYLKTNKSCQPVEKVLQCKTYHQVLNQCIECEKLYFLSNSRCLGRVEIQYCDIYEIAANVCKTCIANYSLAVNKVLCVLSSFVFACLEYDVDSNDILYCRTCQDNQTYKNNQCIPGTVSNCKVYNTDNQCRECYSTHYLKSGACLTRVEVPNCSAKSISIEGVCETCEFKYFKMTRINECKTKLAITNCKTMEFYNKCLTCEPNYYLVTNMAGSTVLNSCELIPKDQFCLEQQYENKCQKCATDNQLSFQKCSMLYQYQYKYCKASSKLGANFNEFACDYCDKGYTPYDLMNTFQCTPLSAIDASFRITHCIKYEFNEVSQRYDCRLCESGYYLTNGFCNQDCSMTNEVILEQVLEKVKIGTSSTYSHIQVSQHKVCGLKDGNMDNCHRAAPDIFMQDTNQLKVNYACIQCKCGAIPVPQVKKTTRYYTGDLTNTNQIIESDSFLMVSPGLKCVVASSITIKGVLNASGEVDNCQYYYALDRENSSPKVYGCFKCKFGFNGDIINYNNIGYIKQCVLFNDERDVDQARYSACNSSVFQYGFTNHQVEINWNLIPLESLLNCHKCIQNDSENNYKPFLFINFEDVWKFPTRTEYNPYENKMKDHVTLLQYKFHKDKEGVLGRPLSCLRVDFNWFFPFTPKMGQSDFWYGFSTNCALYIVNAMKYAYAISTYKVDPGIVSEIVYCGACIPKFKPYLNKKLEGSIGKLDYFMPYKIDGCVAIPNCQSSEWVNNCQYCDANCYWTWDASLKTIRYDNCQLYSRADKVANCQVIYLDSSSQWDCLICKRGYTLNKIMRFCEQVTSPYCEEPENIFSEMFEVNPLKVSLGRNILFYRQKSTGCNICSKFKRRSFGNDFGDSTTTTTSTSSAITCDLTLPTDNYSLTRITVTPNTNSATCSSDRECTLLKECLNTSGCSVVEDLMVSVKVKQTAPRAQHIVCSKSNITTDKLHVLNCEHFTYVESSQVNVFRYRLLEPVCKICNTATHIENQNGVCFLQSSYPNCLKNLITDNSGAYSCGCKIGYSFYAGQCRAQSISNCQTFDVVNSTSSLQKCQTCNNLYYLNAAKTSCIQGTIPNCLVYNQTNGTICELCNLNYQVWVSKKIDVANNVTLFYECLPIDHDSIQYNCKQLVQSQFFNSIWECEFCKDGYEKQAPYSEPRSICYKHKTLNNCVDYQLSTLMRDSYFVCNMCDIHTGTLRYWSDQSAQLCKTRSNLDSQCKQYFLNKDQCEQCISYYFWSTSSSPNKCVYSILGVDGCDLYENIHRCTRCQQGFYLQADSKACIRVTTSQEIQNCGYYQKIGTEVSCLECKPNYAMNNQIKCIIGTIPGCKFYFSLDTTNCKECDTNYFLIHNGTKFVCTTDETITNCIEYYLRKPSQCKRCKASTSVLGYYLDSKACRPVTGTSLIANCKYYQSIDVCFECETGFYITPTHKCDGNTGSIRPNELAELANCLQIIDYGSNECSQCPDGMSFSFYGTSDCSNTDIGSTIWKDGTTTTYTPMPPNCFAFDHAAGTDPGRCVLCPPNYYMNSTFDGCTNVY